ncbi:MAG: ABC transporter permease [Holophagales bacterium]|nr:ABC transporter permease [Holophagales bacterium]
MAVRLHKPSLLRSIGMENVRFALNSIRAQKLRSFLTLLGIVAGVATVIAMVSLVAGFDSSITSAFSAFGSTRVELSKIDPRFGGGDIPPEQYRRPNLTLDDVEMLRRNLTHAIAISPVRSNSWSAISVKNSKGDEASAPPIMGVTPEYLPVNNAEIEDGRFFVQADMAHATRTCVIAPDILKALFPRSDPIGREIYFDGVPMRIIGVLKKKGSAMGNNLDNRIFIPISTFDEMYPQIRLWSWNPLRIYLVPKSAAEVPALIDEIITAMRVRRGLKPNEPNNFAVSSSESNLESMRKITNGIAAVMILIASIALIVGGVGVMNIMLVSVTERTREIGVRKALGATRKDIAAQFLVEAITLTGAGGIVGIILGIGGGYLVKFILEFPAAAPLWSVILGFGVSTSVGLAAGLWPAVKAARQDPIEALRYE